MSTSNGPSGHRIDESVLVSIILLTLYFVNLAFRFKHPDEVLGGQDPEGHAGPQWTPKVAIAVLGGAAALLAVLPDLLSGRDAEAYAKALKGYTDKGVSTELASRIAIQPYLFPALTIVATAAQRGVPVTDAASVHFSLGQRLGLDRLLRRIIELPRSDRWEIMARAALRDDLHAVQADLAAEAMAVSTDGSTKHRISVWEKATPGVAESIKTLRSICDGKPDLAKASVGLRVARGLLPRAS
jgi:glutamate dehydrogenase